MISDILMQLLKLQASEVLISNQFNQILNIWSQYDIYLLATLLTIISIFIIISFHDKRYTIGYELVSPLNYTFNHILENTKEDTISKISNNNDYSKVNYVLKTFNDNKANLDNDIIFMLNERGHLIYANQNTNKLFGITIEEMLGESLFQLYRNIGFDDETWYDEVKRSYDSSNIIKYIRNNEENLVFMNYHANLDMNGLIESILVTGSDVTKIFNSKTLKSFYQGKDQLTGIMNQYGMFNYLKQRHDSNSAIAFFIEAMQFTEMINYYGQVIADKLLNEIANDLKSLGNDDCLVARYTESKFVIIFFDESIDNQKIEYYKNLILKFLNKLNTVDDLTIQIDKRAGYSVYPEDTGNIEEIVSLASIALKNLVTTNMSNIKRYHVSMMESLKYNLDLSNKLKLALDNEKIEVFFQKAINCSNNEIYVVEELSRWYDEEYGYISPLEFFRIAKETNQLERLDGYMVKKSLLHYKTLKKHELYQNSKLTINLSPNTLLNTNFFDYFDKAVKESGLIPNDIYIEISEGTFVNKLELCIERINQYKNAGYLIALDDFGIEYSSLAILQKVDFDVIKLDAHFVKNMDNLSNQEIIKMIRRITDISKKEMIAEGVETKEQSEKLRELGCLIQQGFYLHKPENLVEE